MSGSLERRTTTFVSDELGPVRSIGPLSGGDVAHAYVVELHDGRRVFAKTHASPPPEFFITEATGLEWLAEPGVINVPAVLAVSDDPPVLVLEWIEVGVGASGTRQTEVDFGRALAALHQSGAPQFGRRDGRTTGSRGLPNERRSSWAEFYASQRLLPLARLAADAHALPADAIAGLEQLAHRLPELLGPEEPPARLHGDLWAGNRLVDKNSSSWLIDPACFGGHREFDLAMMRLFGGFGEEAFAAYAEYWPLADGHSDRVLLHQLAPLTVHAIKFGDPYVRATSEAIARYC